MDGSQESEKTMKIQKICGIIATIGICFVIIGRIIEDLLSHKGLQFHLIYPVGLILITATWAGLRRISN
jgi:hypothetical protein